MIPQPPLRNDTTGGNLNPLVRGGRQGWRLTVLSRSSNESGTGKQPDGGVAVVQNAEARIAAVGGQATALHSKPRTKDHPSTTPPKATSMKTESTLPSAFVRTMLPAILAALLPVVAEADTFNIADRDVPGLIAAINTANASAGADTINLAPSGTYTLIAEDNSGNGLPIITSQITINGSGATIQRSSDARTSDFRIFYIEGPNGDLTLNGATIKNGRGSSGAGLLNVSGKLLLMNSTVTGNKAMGDSYGHGGGIGNYYNATLIAANSTISHNTGWLGGGGIANFVASATIINSTIFENIADGPPGFQGGGDAIADAWSSAGSIIVKNSILASPTQGLGDDIGIAAGVLTSLGHNIIGDASGALMFTASGDLISTDPLLGPLANNGGPTPTHAPLPGSPAIDAVPLADCTDVNGAAITSDQRGVVRPQGAACEIGSFELCVLDSDGDGIPDCVDLCPFDPLKTAPGTCGCGVPDTDSDGDGIPDCIDNCLLSASLTNVVVVAECASVTIEVTTTGGPQLTYAWEKSCDGGVTFTPIKKANASTYTIDRASAADSGCQFRITVTSACGSVISGAAPLFVIPDFTPPLLFCSLQTTLLLPAVHTLTDVGLSFTTSDPCSPVKTTVTVYSDESKGPAYPVDATYAKNKLKLRNQRDPKGDGRVYLIVVTATDSVGNSTFCGKTVVVPLQNDATSIDNVNAQAATALASCTASGSPLTSNVILTVP